MEFVKDFLIYEAGALCGFFIAALMNAARAGQEIAIKFEEDKHSESEEPPMTENKTVSAACTVFPPTSRWISTRTMKQTFPCSARRVTNLPKQRAGSSSMKNKKKACLVTKSAQKPVTSCKSSRNTPERANLIFCWCSCSTVSDASQMKRHLS